MATRCRAPSADPLPPHKPVGKLRATLSETFAGKPEGTARTLNSILGSVTNRVLDLKSHSHCLPPCSHPQNWCDKTPWPPSVEGREDAGQSCRGRGGAALQGGCAGAHHGPAARTAGSLRSSRSPNNISARVSPQTTSGLLSPHFTCEKAESPTHRDRPNQNQKMTQAYNWFSKSALLT